MIRLDANQSAQGVSYIQRMAKAMADPLRIKILTELNKRVMSPTEFVDDFGGDLSKVSRNFRTLEQHGWAEVVREERGGRRRGAVEHFYRATQPAFFDSVSWSTLPESMKDTVTGVTFATYVEQVREAMLAGTIDARDDSHLSWTGLLLDETGWTNVVARMDALFEFVHEEQVRAGLRMAESGEEAIPATVSLAAFESPKESDRPSR